MSAGFVMYLIGASKDMLWEANVRNRGSFCSRFAFKSDFFVNFSSFFLSKIQIIEKLLDTWLSLVI